MNTEERKTPASFWRPVPGGAGVGWLGRRDVEVALGLAFSESLGSVSLAAAVGPDASF